MSLASELHALRQKIDGQAKEECGNIRQNVAAAMQMFDVDTDALSAVSGVSPSTIRQFLRGTDSGISKVVALSKALGIPLDDFTLAPNDFAVKYFQ